MSRQRTSKPHQASRHRPQPGRAGQQPQQSVVKEAWDNYRADLARLLPAGLAKKLESRRVRIGLTVAVTLLELVVLGVVGKWLYTWWTG